MSSNFDLPNIDIDLPDIDEKLLEATNTYWKLHTDDRKNDAWDFYLGVERDEAEQNDSLPEVPDLDVKPAWMKFPLIYYEVEKARNESKKGECWPKTKDDAATTLVILVGTSFEPLLQAIWAYEPQYILPVLNEYYGDESRKTDDFVRPEKHWRNFVRLYRRLPSAIKKKLQKDLESYQPPRFVKDTPGDVFDFLQDNLKDKLTDAKHRIVIDITGAKKTMVAGAYLFAAYTGTEISYVDFKRFSKEKGRPYGFTCCIHPVENPIKELAIKQWDNVKAFYENYNFGPAVDILSSLPEKPQTLLGEKFDQLKTFLEVCKHWENGELREAKNAAQGLINKTDEIGKYLPTTIMELAEFWPSSNSPKQWLSPRFLKIPEHVVHHAYDELERAKWYAGLSGLRSKHPSIQPQNRLAFSKAYALHETLFKARVVALFFQNRLVVGFSEADSLESYTQLSISRCAKWLNWILSSMMTWQTLRLLKEGVVEVLIRDSENKRKLHVTDGNQIYMISSEDYDRIWDESLRDPRNLMTHTYVPVKDHLVERAIQVTENNLQHYIEHSAKKKNMDVSELTKLKKVKRYVIRPWKDVKELFKIEFIPNS